MARPRKVPAKWIRNPVDQLAVRRGYRFDPDRGERAIEFTERFCKQSIGEWAGEPLKLIDWQKDYYMRLFSWLEPEDDVRRFRRSYLEIAKKNGKSTMLSSIGLYLLVGDDEPGPHVFTAACDREQASIIFDESAKMVRQSPTLDKRLEVIDSRKTITYPAENGKLKALSADVDNKDGANASGVLVDELHRHRNPRLYNVLRYAGISRRQPLLIGISTAGEAESGLWHAQRKHAEAVNAGQVEDLQFLGVVYRTDPKADLHDPKVWRHANPSMGVTIKEADFAAELAEAEAAGGADWADFLRLRFNIVASATGRFVTDAEWDSCQAQPDGARPGRACYSGLDLSSKHDLTALVHLFDDGSILWRLWTPEATLHEREKRDNATYAAWVASGHLIACPGSVIDYDMVKAQILEDRRAFAMRKLLIDPHQAEYFGQQLLNVHGLDVEFLHQGFGAQNEPTQELLSLIRAGKLKHGGHPVARWMAGNAAAEKHAEGWIRLTKKRSTGRIDGMSGLVSAVAARMAAGAKPDDTGPSIYESQRLFRL